MLSPAAIARLKTLINYCVVWFCGPNPHLGDQSRIKLNEYVKTAEAAEILGVAQNTLRFWARDGKIPLHQNPANGDRLFRRGDLQAFLKRIERPVKLQ